MFFSFKPGTSKKIDQWQKKSAGDFCIGKVVSFASYLGSTSGDCQWTGACA